MNSLMRVLGIILRLVGVSSPEDTQAKTKSAAGLPSWRKAAESQNPATREPQE
jgi:hypothetical protein